MMQRLLLFIIFVAIITTGYSQAVFTSSSGGDWSNPSSWTLTSGTSTLNYPVAGDSVVIQNAHAILITNNMQCKSLTVRGAAILNISSNTAYLTVSSDLLLTEAAAANIAGGILTITGNLTVNQQASMVQTGGAISIIGLAFINSPTTSAGNTTLDIANGVFTCAGGMTVTATTVPAGRIAELKIGNSAVNMIGALTAISANAKITFTGIGTLTLAGIITIPNPLSFTAGNGRVIYVGIPGTSQTISPLTYSSLWITGAGNGTKIINANVTVTDSLVLLSDTLQVSNPGTLSLGGNSTIAVTNGKLLSVPVYLGQVDILYNGLQKDTTGAEMPVATNILRNLFINNTSGVQLGNNITVNNQLGLQNGALSTGNFILTISNAAGGVVTDPAIDRLNGYVQGKMNRAIGTVGGLRIFPFGIGLLQGYREFKINFTAAPDVAGTLSVQHVNSVAAAQSGLPLTDGAVIVSTTQPYYWQADALNGLAGGNYDLTLTAGGSTGVTDYTSLRIVKRPSTGGAWILDGTAGINSGTNTAPVIVRNGMSNFSQFAIGNTGTTLPLKLLSFSGVKTYTGVLLTWKTTSEINTAYFDIEKSTDGRSFARAGRVYPVSPTSGENTYQYADAGLPGEKYTYRLKMVDADGSFTYSETLSLTVALQSRLVVYPTITTGFIHVSSAGNQPVYLFDAGGKAVQKISIGTNNISQLKNGMYFLSTANDTIKIVKQ